MDKMSVTRITDETARVVDMQRAEIRKLRNQVKYFFAWLWNQKFLEYFFKHSVRCFEVFCPTLIVKKNRRNEVRKKKKKKRTAVYRKKAEPWLAEMKNWFQKESIIYLR